MKLKKRKLKFVAISGLCLFVLLVILVDVVLKFPRVVDFFGSYALTETVLILSIVIPTVAVYCFTKE